MIKIRNKRIALLLVLAMLATMFVGVGTASATNFIDVDSTWSWVADDATTVNVSDIMVTQNDPDYGNLAAHGNVFVEVNLPDGVEFSADPNVGTGTIVTRSGGSLIVNTNAGSGNYAIGGIDLKVDKGITGSINASVRVYAYKNASTLFALDETESTLIAKVSSTDITVSAASAKNVYIGDEQKGANITIKEVGPMAFDNMDEQNIKLTILAGGVTWDGAPTVAGTYTTTSQTVPTDKVVYVSSLLDDNTQVSKIVVTPYFKVSPVASGEIKVRVSGDNIDTTEFVVAKVGKGDVAVTVTDADQDFVYRGQFATFDDVTVTLDPGNEMSEDDWFSITLPENVKFADVDDPVDINTGDIAFEELIKSDRTAWFTANNDFDTKVKLTDFVVVADADATLGDLAITFAGAVEGTYVIGSVKDAFSITTTPFNTQASLTGIKGADIIIKETADGALKTSFSNNDDDAYLDVDNDLHEYGYFGIVLPAGVTFVGTPEVDVTEGDLEIGDVYIGEDFRSLSFEITAGSNIDSTITISGIQYSILSQPALGDLVSFVGGSGAYEDTSYNIYGSTPLAKLVMGSIATNPTAVYVIGASTFTVSGVVTPVVAPSYVKNNRAYMAIRDICTGLGIDPTNVLWDELNQRVTMIKGNKIVQVTIGSQIMNVNGTAIMMDVAPEMGPAFRAMLPAAFIAQAFGATAYWDGLTNTVTIK